MPARIQEVDRRAPNPTAILGRDPCRAMIPLPRPSLQHVARGLPIQLQMALGREICASAPCRAGWRKLGQSAHTGIAAIRVFEEVQVSDWNVTKEKVMNAEQKKAHVRRYYDEVWSQGKVGGLSDLVADDYENHDPATPGKVIRGRDAFRSLVGTYREAFPDLRFEIVEQYLRGRDRGVAVVCAGDPPRRADGHSGDRPKGRAGRGDHAFHLRRRPHRLRSRGLGSVRIAARARRRAGLSAPARGGAARPCGRHGTVAAMGDGEARLAELLGSLSLATDIAAGLGAETALRTAVYAVRLAGAAGLQGSSSATPTTRGCCGSSAARRIHTRWPGGTAPATTSASCARSTRRTCGSPGGCWRRPRAR